MLSISLWAGFILFVFLMLGIDLGLLHKKGDVISARRAALWTGLCIATAMLFNIAVYFIYKEHWLGGTEPARLSGSDAAKFFFTGWLIEQSLSLDNIFVIALIFEYFRVPRAYQHRTLFWGILGALVMRGAMIGAGAALIRRFDWITYVFGGLLMVTAYKMYRSKEESVDPDRNPLVRIARRLYPVTPEFHKERFFVRMNGKAAITPLFLVLLVVESTDLLFAVDSIPAIFAVTKEPFIVFTSNVFAILNLRSMYFVLASAIDKFKYLKPSLILVLAYVGVKLILTHTYEISSTISMLVVLGVLGGGVVASVVSNRRQQRRTAHH